MAELDVNKYIQTNRHPCPYCGNESKRDKAPDMMICINHIKTGGPRHSWNVVTGE